MTEAIRYCAVVPTYNHWQVIGGVVRALRSAGLPVFIVDDGSAEPAVSVIAALHRPDDGVIVDRLPANQGKGAAVIHGMRLAWQAGFTHAVQIDADGQHDPDALPVLLECSRRNPAAMVSAEPIFDASMPMGRRIGRWITHFWVWVETLSFQISDSMCGFRIYPLAAVRALLETESVGTRMDFDTEVMVRLFWRGTPVEMVPSRVIYPPDNTSNFRMWADNVRISAMHTRLVFGMLIRRARPRHWSRLRERGAYWGLAFTAAACRLLGRRGSLAVLAPVVAYFMLTGTEQRAASRAFLTRTTGHPAGLWDVYRHMMGFAGRAVDSFRAWTGAIPPGAVTTATETLLRRTAADPRGALMVISHFGNIDLARALLDDATRNRLTILAHTRHAVNYNRLLREFRPEAAVNMLQVTEIGPETAIDLQQRIDAGAWVVIAGDRTPVSGDSHTSRVPFIGQDGAFAHGPWILASILRCPVYLLFCARAGNGWRLTLEEFAERIDLPRKGRQDVLRGLAARYAARLESHVRADPMQWYNFFDFWAR